MSNPLAKKRLLEFQDVFPFWAPRVVRWRPSGLFGVEIWLNDGNHFLFSKKGKRQILSVLKGTEKKGTVIYDSATDNRKGL